MNLARIDNRGNLGDLSRYERYSHLVLANRIGFLAEHPGELATLAAQRFSNRTMIYYSPVDAVRDWTDWDRQADHFEVAWTKTVEKYHGWLRPDADDKPTVLYWNGPPERYATDLTIPGFPKRWVQLVNKRHEAMEKAAGKRLGLFIDNVWDATSLPGRWASTGDIDYRTRWQAGMTEALVLLAQYLPRRRAFLNTKVGTYSRWANGAWMEHWPTGHPIQGVWRHPVLHVYGLPGRTWAQREPVVTQAKLDGAICGEDASTSGEPDSDWAGD